MGYSYTPHSSNRHFLNKKGRQLLLAAVVVFLIAAFYLIGNTLTGYATYSRNLEQQLNSTRDALLMAQEQKEECRELLWNTNSELNECSDQLTSLQTSLGLCSNNTLQLTNEIQKLNNNVKNLSNSLDQCRTETESALDRYEHLAESSAKPICCSFGDIQSGATRNWNIANNAVVCSGNYTVNCGTGETAY